MLLDRCSPTPTPEVGHLPPGQVSPVTCPQSNVSSRSLAPLVKAHTKPAYYVSRSGLGIKITVRYGYAASIGSLVWALTRGRLTRGR